MLRTEVRSSGTALCFFLLSSHKPSVGFEPENSLFRYMRVLLFQVMSALRGHTPRLPKQLCPERCGEH
eukprot:1776185-Amphidinium_carterae.1